MDMPIPANGVLDQIRVVLCRPQLPENIGGVCRAMKSMGITRLDLVGAEGVDLDRAAVIAVHAADVLRAHHSYATLPEAVKDSALVAGVTRRAGRWRKYFQLTPDSLAERITEGGATPVSVVFGNEASGLDDTELGCCHLSVRIPSSDLFPSLNLSHAVQVVTYALHTRLAPHSIPDVRRVSTSRLERVSLAAADALREAGFFTQVNDHELRVFMRDILARSSLVDTEADRMESLLHTLREMIAHLRRSGLP